MGCSLSTHVPLHLLPALGDGGLFDRDGRRFTLGLLGLAVFILLLLDGQLNLLLLVLLLLDSLVPAFLHDLHPPGGLLLVPPLAVDAVVLEVSGVPALAAEEVAEPAVLLVVHRTQ
jgi:hypothetical protein